MAKKGKQRKSAADSVYAKKTNAQEKANPFATTKAATSKRLNPFEVHMNKEKFDILGRTCKHNKGLPGVSRSRANKKRKETLGIEFREKHKSNQFRDRRIGRRLGANELDDNVLDARFVADKLSQVKHNGRISIFNLNEDEVLTHRGQTLKEIEEFNDERSDDENSEDDALNAEFTETAHFGGADLQTKDRKLAIEEMVTEQKRKKMELVKEKEEINELTAKLDANYKSLVGLMAKQTKDERKQKPPMDDYERIVREMVFEPRGVVTDKLLSEDELAKRERERLERLENERLKRMQDDSDFAAENRPNHRSADDLDDGYFANAEEERDVMLTYNADGTINTKSLGLQQTEIEQQEQREEQNEQSAEEDGDAESESADEENDDLNLSDLKESESEEEKEELSVAKANKLANTNKNTEKTVLYEEIPFIIDVPDTYEELQALLSSFDVNKHVIIVERILKSNHPKLDIANKSKINKFFAFLLQYIDERFSASTQDDIGDNFKILDRLCPHIFDLLNLNVEATSVTLLRVIKEKYAEYCKNQKMFPPLESVVFLKLVANLYSTSDFRHAVVTPCYIFIQHVLSHARVRTRQDIAMGLLLVTIYLEYSHYSKRVLPGAFNFLLGCIYLSIPKRPIEVIKIVPPFQTTGPMNKLLAIAHLTDKHLLKEELLKSEDLMLNLFTTEFRVRALNMTLRMLNDALRIVCNHVGANYLADTFLTMLERLPLENYPSFVHTNYEAVKISLETIATKSLNRLTAPEKKSKVLRMLEPRIEAVYDDKRRPKLSKEKEEKAKLMHKLKRETKGAVREIRRDTEFIQKMRLQQQIQSDMERIEKVKRIYQEASIQQGELNELVRAKKRKKF